MSYKVTLNVLYGELVTTITVYTPCDAIAVGFADAPPIITARVDVRLTARVSQETLDNLLAYIGDRPGTIHLAVLDALPSHVTNLTEELNALIAQGARSVLVTLTERSLLIAPSFVKFEVKNAVHESKFDSALFLHVLHTCPERIYAIPANLAVMLTSDDVITYLSSRLNTLNLRFI